MSKGINPAGSARQRVRGVNRDIINDARMQLPQEFHAGQNIAAAAILLQTLSELEDQAQRNLHRQVRNLVELTAIQQAESSSLHRRQAAASCPAGGVSHCEWEPSEVQHPPLAQQANLGGAPAPAAASAPLPPRPPIHDRVGPNYDARSVIHGRQQARHHAEIGRAHV